MGANCNGASAAQPIIDNAIIAFHDNGDLLTDLRTSRVESETEAVLCWLADGGRCPTAVRRIATNCAAARPNAAVVRLTARIWMAMHHISLRRFPLAGLLLAAAIVAPAAGCGKKVDSPPQTTAAAGSDRGAAVAVQPGPALPVGATESQAAVAPPPAPPPSLPVELGAYIEARVLEQCAVQFHEDPIVAETRAVQALLGRQPVVDLSHVYDSPAKDAHVRQGAKPKSAAQDPDTPDQLSMRQKFRASHNPAAAHAPTKAAIEGRLKDCVYAPETGLVAPELLQRYQACFVEIACLQRKHTGENGVVDATAHAQAAATVFAANNFNAGDFARYGLIFGRFPSVQAKLHAAKALACPDPRVQAEAARTTGEWNGSLAGERNAALNLRGDGGKVRGAVQWLGATVRYADGKPETQAIQVEGVISAQSVALFGETGGDWVRLEGKVVGDRLEGTWSGQRAMTDKFKGTWTAQKLPADLPRAATATGK